jgi:hypothetical protein
LAFLSFFEKINVLKRQLKLKPKEAVSSKKRKAESILSTEIHLTTSNDDGEQKCLFTSTKPFSSSKTKLKKSPHSTTNHFGSDPLYQQ